MGILNVTPDSFSDGGHFNTRERALRHAEQMAKAGADIIDVGGESTRPGAAKVSLQEELERVIPVIEAIAERINIAISIDTSKAAVMRAAVQAGASLINDVNALRAPEALKTAIELHQPVCLMHMHGEPGTMQNNPQYEDIVNDVRTFLLERAGQLRQGGFSTRQILLDPGFGFGKTTAHNLHLLRHLATFSRTSHPVLVGLSRKSMLGAITGRQLSERLPASLAVAYQALQNGARILRVHDVAPTLDIVKVWQAIQETP